MNKWPSRHRRTKCPTAATGVAVYTNNVPVAAFNGFGNPYGFCHRVKSTCWLRVEYRSGGVQAENALVPGRDRTGQLLDHSVSELIEKVAQRADWTSKRKNAETARAQRNEAWAWVAAGMAAARPTEARLGRGIVILQRDGSVNYCTGLSVGQGTITSHAMMVAETLGIPTHGSAD